MLLAPGGLLDLFCGMGGLSAGFREAGYAPLAGVDNDARVAEAYGKNFPGAEVFVGDVTDRRLRDTLVERYGVGGTMLAPGGRLAAVVGGPPCVGLSAANLNRSVDNPVNRLPFEFVELAAALGPDAIVMEQSHNLYTMKTAEGDTLASRLLGALRSAGYVCAATVLKAEDYGVPQRRKRTFIVAVRGALCPEGTLPVRFPPPATTAGRPACAGDVLKPPFSGEALVGAELDRVKARDAMTKGEAGRMNWFPRRAYTSMDLTQPSPTIRTYVHTAAGAFTLRDEGRGTYHRMGVREMLQLQTFPASYEVPEGVTAARTGVGNAVPVKLALAVARGLHAAL